MNTKNDSGLGWRLSLAAGALTALSVGCGSDVRAPANDIGDSIQDSAVATVPAAPDGVTPRRCAVGPLEARAEKKSLCRE
jgi:hypothetical protein